MRKKVRILQEWSKFYESFFLFYKIKILIFFEKIEKIVRVKL